MVLYKSAKSSNEIIAIAGWGVNGIKLTKHAFILPGQICSRIDLLPYDYTLNVEAKTSEEIPFHFQTKFSVGFNRSDPESLVKYSKLLSVIGKMVVFHGCTDVNAVIQKEICVLVGTMTVYELFERFGEFKQQVRDNVQLGLNKFGLVISESCVKIPEELVAYIDRMKQIKAAEQIKEMFEEYEADHSPSGLVLYHNIAGEGYFVDQFANSDIEICNDAISPTKRGQSSLGDSSLEKMILSWKEDPEFEKYLNSRLEEERSEKERLKTELDHYMKKADKLEKMMNTLVEQLGSITDAIHQPNFARENNEVLDLLKFD